jgi:hypothetical protein
MSVATMGVNMETENASDTWQKGTEKGVAGYTAN